jgi:hypothetical protein
VKDWQTANRPHAASVPNDGWPDELWMTVLAAVIIVGTIGGIVIDRLRAKSRADDGERRG